MGWFSRLWNFGRTQPPDPDEKRIWFTGKTQAGVYVTPDRALQNATVWACVNYLTRTHGQLPWNVFVPKEGGGADRSPLHPVDRLLNTRPCPDMGSFSWRQAMLGNALLWGNAYAEIERDARNVPVALWPIHPCRVEVDRGPDGYLIYRVQNANSVTVDLSQSDIFHIRGFGDGPVGYSVIEYAAQSIGWAQATELFGAAYFGEGMNPTGVLSTDKSLSIDGLVQLRAEMKKLYTGPKAERTAILDAGMKFEKISTDPENAQFTEVRQHQVEEICRWFGVPPHKVQHMLRSTFSNIEHQSIEVVVDTITPWVKVFEEEADWKLFGTNRQGLFTKMNLNGLLRGDAASRAAFYKSLFEMGVLNANQILALEDMNGIGADGDERFVSTNLRSLKQALAEPVEPMPAIAPPPKTNGKRLPN